MFLKKVYEWWKLEQLISIQKKITPIWSFDNFTSQNCKNWEPLNAF